MQIRRLRDETIMTKFKTLKRMILIMNLPAGR